MTRRTLLQALPAIVALTESVAAQQQQQPNTPQRITKEMLQQALELAGLKFTDAQITMMLPGVNRNLTAYEALRKVTVPLDTEPAIHFTPQLPGFKLPSGPARWTRGKPVRIAAWKSPEDLAFLPATQLATLVRTRRITP